MNEYEWVNVRQYKVLWWPLGLWKRYINAVHLPFVMHSVICILLKGNILWEYIHKTYSHVDYFFLDHKFVPYLQKLFALLYLQKHCNFWSCTNFTRAPDQPPKYCHCILTVKTLWLYNNRTWIIILIPELSYFNMNPQLVNIWTNHEPMKSNP